jgi:hypothetical protein
MTMLPLIDSVDWMFVGSLHEHHVVRRSVAAVGAAEIVIAAARPLERSHSAEQ